MNLMVFWLIVLILLLITEAATMGLTTIWFAGGSMVALVLALCNVSFGIQVTVFFIISFLLLFFTRPLALSFFNGKRIKTNLDSMIGERAVVVKEIDNLRGEGQVNYKGMEWSAKSCFDERIEAGKIVIVKEIQGVKLIVEEEENKEEI